MMAVSAACFVALLGAMLLSTRPGSNDVVTSWAGPITIEASTDEQAGSTVLVTVNAPAIDGTLVQLGVFSAFNATLLEEPLQEGSATFSLASELTSHAGTYRLVGQLDRSVSVTHTLQVRPGQAVDPVVPLVGPRTIIADGADITMTVVTPTDQFGNPVANGTGVSIDVLRPDGNQTTIIEMVERSIAAVIIEATTETGRTTISTFVGQADGPSNVVDQVAGTPATFTIEADMRNPLADGFTLHAVQTSELTDRFGNTLPDGVSAVFVIDDGRGISLVNATVQGGVARGLIEAPSGPGDLIVTARVSGAESLPAVLSFLPAVDEFEAITTPSASGDTLQIGPVLTQRGGYVPDGTLVIVRIVDTGEVVLRGGLRGGVLEQELVATTGPYEVEVLGVVTTVDVGGDS